LSSLEENNIKLDKFMKHFVDRLPIDIVFKIIPYTYSLQNKNVLHDIVNFAETKKTLLKLYNSYWVQYNEEDEDKNWLINDIFAYANDYHATMYGYVDKFYRIFERHICLQNQNQTQKQSKEKIDKYVHNLEKESVETQINIFLGLLNIKERNDLIMAAPRII
jgi:hypothetical protein